jgi:PAS domain S-box-containing protein
MPPTRLAPVGAAGEGPPARYANGHLLSFVFVTAPAIATGVGIYAAMAGLIGSVEQFAAAVAVPLLIGVFLFLGRTRPRARLIAAGLLDVEAILTGAAGPAGMAFAIALPLIAVGLVQPMLRGRSLLVAFGASAIAAAAGVAAAVFVGPAHALFGTQSAVLTLMAFVAITIFALALDWRSTYRLLGALDAAKAEIAARDAAEAELDRTSDILSAIVRSSPVATQAFGADRTITIWNPASERIFGWTAAELIGQRLPIEMIPPEEREESAKRIERTLAGGVQNGERVRRLTKDGEERWVDIYAAPLLARDGTAIGIAGQMVDVTERVRIEAQLAQAQKMGAVGLLASGIAHDFNNTLTAAGGYAELIRGSSEGSVREDATTLIEVVDRGRQLTRQLLDFARRGDGAAGLVDLRHVIVGIEPLIRRLIGSSIAVELSLAGEALNASIQVGQLEQALINLAINARDAMPEGGRLRIIVDVAGSQPRILTGDGVSSIVAVERDRPAREDDLEITVSDDGIGIPATVLASVFEPFFTTKPVGAGTGLGLAMVRGFVEAAGGGLVVTSAVGQGTTFTIRLPRCRDDVG